MSTKDLVSYVTDDLDRYYELHMIQMQNLLMKQKTTGKSNSY